MTRRIRKGRKKIKVPHDLGSDGKTLPTDDKVEANKAKSEKRKEKINAKDRRDLCDFEDLVEENITDASTADDAEEKFLPDK